MLIFGAKKKSPATLYSVQLRSLVLVGDTGLEPVKLYRVKPSPRLAMPTHSLAYNSERTTVIVQLALVLVGVCLLWSQFGEVSPGCDHSPVSRRQGDILDSMFVNPGSRSKPA